ncbi:hypothetical protein B9Z19DRAFT_108671 [Tuber borchii]|uniref:Uncharacterized protein n=1 Tax=Tuber borchii TaxID=42251 RepID=A0A2T7A6M0_TUBBO|nr:hypothetical protein B9Z19DRAFT_108671 [Tuber borchii]
MIRRLVILFRWWIEFWLVRSGKWGLESQWWIQGGLLLLGPAEGCFGAAWSGYLGQTGMDWQRLLVAGAVDTTGSRSRRERRIYRYGIWYKFACDTQVLILTIRPSNCKYPAHCIRQITRVLEYTLPVVTIVEYSAICWPPLLIIFYRYCAPVRSLNFKQRLCPPSSPF